eukprot:CAMPEP_0202689954 /NCGR_PEP_ID=MMETSP1385-20130828/5118_1 /ASSEMBLY_ACC=CAM_ASM_000861 /TAXON_ID=933848 /ORGANISM="Elphidium margaritaceum" /LENGTH=320 /DNA_ID=CAMNT_0049345175 /DNA_START=93 /DNA_END=1055 /DNA_ORIENTATION=+
MSHCQIVLLHHDNWMCQSVLDQFERSLIHQPNNNALVQYHVLQSKRTLTQLISDHTDVDMDVSRVIAEFSPPPLIVMRSHSLYGSTYYNFVDHFVDFNDKSLVAFASQYLQQRHNKPTKTCFINLFDEKEAKLLTAHEEDKDDGMDSSSSSNNMLKTYRFLTRLYSAAFDSSHHIHLFAKHHRSNIDDEGRCMDAKEAHRQSMPMLMQMKRMNVYEGMQRRGNNQTLKTHHITTSHLASMRILSQLLSAMTVHDKLPPMALCEINGSVSWIAKIKLRLNVAQEIRSIIDPLCLETNALIKHILKTQSKHQSHSNLRLSFT